MRRNQQRRRPSGSGNVSSHHRHQSCLPRYENDHKLLSFVAPLSYPYAQMTFNSQATSKEGLTVALSILIRFQSTCSCIRRIVFEFHQFSAISVCSCADFGVVVDSVAVVPNLSCTTGKQMEKKQRRKLQNVAVRAASECDDAIAT